LRRSSLGAATLAYPPDHSGTSENDGRDPGEWEFRHASGCQRGWVGPFIYLPVSRVCEQCVWRLVNPVPYVREFIRRVAARWLSNVAPSVSGPLIHHVWAFGSRQCEDLTINRPDGVDRSHGRRLPLCLRRRPGKAASCSGRPEPDAKVVGYHQVLTSGCDQPIFELIPGPVGIELPEVGPGWCL